MAARIDLVVLGAAFEVRLELRTRDAHRPQGVLIGIDAGYVRQTDRTGWKAALEIERCRRGKLGAGHFLLHRLDELDDRGRASASHR